MTTLVYSPAVRVVISTIKYGIIDVTEDIVSGSVSRRRNGVSSMNLELLNGGSKYTNPGVFTPMDRIHLQAKRIRWLPVFSGYLNQVPFFSVYPRSVSLTASCTLKRVQNTYWDPGSNAAVDLLFGSGTDGDPDRYDENGDERLDGGMKQKVIRLLREVGNWPEGHIHIGALPSEWMEKINKVYDEMAPELQVPQDTLGPGSGSIIGGKASGNALGIGTASITSDIPGTGQIPATSGKASYFAGVGNTDATGGMALTGEPGTNPTDKWYCAMRWPYQRMTHQGFQTLVDDVGSAIEWWKNRKILAVNPKNNKGVVLRAADWGPANTVGDRSIDMSRHALETVLGAHTDDVIQTSFAPASFELGPVTEAEIRAYSNTHATDGWASGKAGSKNKKVTTDTGYSDGPDGAAEATGSQIDMGNIRFQANDGNQPWVAAALQFIQANWTVKGGIGGYRTEAVDQDGHPAGRALDVMVLDDYETGNSIVSWFLNNPDTFGMEYIIWQQKINTGSGWEDMDDRGSHTANHMDHPHINFKANGPMELAPGGSPFKGTDLVAAGFQGGMGTQYGSAKAGSDGTFLNLSEWYGQVNPESEILYGKRALMNDEALSNTVDKLLAASMRDWQSAPNGDFIAWFPDYFGMYGTAGRMFVEDIEVSDFHINWDDERLATHYFATGAATGASVGSIPSGGAYEAWMDYQTMGVASVEFPQIMRALFNVGDDKTSAWMDAAAILERFGARPAPKEFVSTLRQGKPEFWYALHRFTQIWAQQFSASVSLTWMPELYPGMLLVLKEHDFQAYVETVSHSFSHDGGMWTTSVGICAPSSLGGGLYGLPQAGDPNQGLGRDRELGREEDHGRRGSYGQGSTREAR